jgi:hypothetical protein
VDFLVAGWSGCRVWARDRDTVLGGRVYRSSSAADREEQRLSHHRLHPVLKRPPGLVDVLLGDLTCRQLAARDRHWVIAHPSPGGCDG